MEVALFDSNIVIDALNGIDQAVLEIRYYKRRVISAVTWMEAITKPLAHQIADQITNDRMLAIHTFVSTFTVIHTDDDIMTEAAAVRASSLYTRLKFYFLTQSSKPQLTLLAISW
jgi:predicted nucleic acid-binding protein